ncbi:MAG: type II toxin-antitoxin system HigB family toxin [Xanthobacteraceae bacterium]
MQVISKRKLREFWQQHPRAKTPLTSWLKVASKAAWTGPADIKRAFGANVDFVAGNRVMFDIGGNKYRLIAYVLYAPYYRMLIKFVGTHADYDRINPETV